MYNIAAIHLQQIVLNSFLRTVTHVTKTSNKHVKYFSLINSVADMPCLATLQALQLSAISSLHDRVLLLSPGYRI